MVKKEDKKEMDEKAMMEIYVKLGTPGAPHKLLEGIAGTWTAKSKMGMETGKTMEETGISEQKMVLE